MAELRTPQGHTLLLPDGCVSVGADPSNDVPVAPHLGLAPIHFRLQPWEGGHFLEDAGSGLGTLVNGHPVNWKPLNPGDVIVAGELEVVYRHETKPATTPVPAIVAPAPPEGLMAAFPLPPPPTLPAPPHPVFEAGSPAINPPRPIGDPPPRRPESGPGPILPHAYEAAPPAWLPVDLLPETYRDSIPSVQHVPDNQHPSLPPGDLPKGSRRAGRRVLAWAAVCAVLAWAGHKVWREGRLDPIYESLRGAAGQAISSPVPSGHATGLPAAPPAAHSPSPGTKPATPPTVPRITTQIGR
jgi:hypothetical protein